MELDLPQLSNYAERLEAVVHSREQPRTVQELEADLELSAEIGAALVKAHAELTERLTSAEDSRNEILERLGQIYRHEAERERRLDYWQERCEKAERDRDESQRALSRVERRARKAEVRVETLERKLKDLDYNDFDNNHDWYSSTATTTTAAGITATTTTDYTNTVSSRAPSAASHYNDEDKDSSALSTTSSAGGVGPSGPLAPRRRLSSRSASPAPSSTSTTSYHVLATSSTCPNSTRQSSLSLSARRRTGAGLIPLHTRSSSRPANSVPNSPRLDDTPAKVSIGTQTDQHQMPKDGTTTLFSSSSTSSTPSSSSAARFPGLSPLLSRVEDFISRTTSSDVPMIESRLKRHALPPDDAPRIAAFALRDILHEIESFPDLLRRQRSIFWTIPSNSNDNNNNNNKSNNVPDHSKLIQADLRLLTRLLKQLLISQVRLQSLSNHLIQNPELSHILSSSDIIIDPDQQQQNQNSNSNNSGNKFSTSSLLNVPKSPAFLAPITRWLQTKPQISETSSPSLPDQSNLSPTNNSSSISNYSTTIIPTPQLNTKKSSAAIGLHSSTLSQYSAATHQNHHSHQHQSTNSSVLPNRAAPETSLAQPAVSVELDPGNGQPHVRRDVSGNSNSKQDQSRLQSQSKKSSPPRKINSSTHRDFNSFFVGSLSRASADSWVVLDGPLTTSQAQRQRQRQRQQLLQSPKDIPPPPPPVSRHSRSVSLSNKDDFVNEQDEPEEEDDKDEDDEEELDIDSTPLGAGRSKDSSMYDTPKHAMIPGASLSKSNSPFANISGRNTTAKRPFHHQRSTRLSRNLSDSSLRSTFVSQQYSPPSGQTGPGSRTRPRKHSSPIHKLVTPPTPAQTEPVNINVRQNGEMNENMYHQENMFGSLSVSTPLFSENGTNKFETSPYLVSASAFSSTSSTNKTNATSERLDPLTDFTRSIRKLQMQQEARLKALDERNNSGLTKNFLSSKVDAAKSFAPFLFTNSTHASANPALESNSSSTPGTQSPLLSSAPQSPLKSSSLQAPIRSRFINFGQGTRNDKETGSITSGTTQSFSPSTANNESNGGNGYNADDDDNLVGLGIDSQMTIKET